MEDDDFAELGFEEDPAEGLDFQDDPDQVPEDYAETGARVLELPEITIEGTPEGTGTVTMAPGAGTEYREIEKAWEGNGNAAPDDRSTRERLVDYIRGDATALGTGNMTPLAPTMAGDDVASWGGREFPSLPSIRRSIAAGVDLDVLMPAANTDAPIVGTDRRPLAAATGATDAATFGFIDELAGLVRGRDAVQSERDRSAESQEQSGAEYGTGYIGGSAPLALVPGSAPTAAGRIAAAGVTGGAAGFLRGAGESEATDGIGRIDDGVQQAALEGLLSAGTAGAGEAVAAGMSGLARRIGGSQSMRQARQQAGLEARGIWARRSQDAVRQRPGGADALLRDLDELGAPLDPRDMISSGGQPGFIDRMLTEGGEQVGATVRQMDDVGATVPGPAVADRIRRLAGEQAADVAPLSGSDAAQAALLERAGRVEAAGDLPFSVAHGERRAIDQLVNWGNPDQSLSVIGGQRQGMRRALSSTMQDAADGAGLGEQWRMANRRYALGAELDDVARGAERLNAQGGIAGAESRASGLRRMLTGPGIRERALGAVEAIGGPAAGQEMRLRLPGMQYRAIDRVLRSQPQLRRAANVMRAANQRGGPAPAAAHALLMRSDPEYRAAIQAAESEAPEGVEATND
jgi:hypothetical protein